MLFKFLVVFAVAMCLWYVVLQPLLKAFVWVLNECLEYPGRVRFLREKAQREAEEAEAERQGFMRVTEEELWEEVDHHRHHVRVMKEVVGGVTVLSHTSSVDDQ